MPSVCIMTSVHKHNDIRIYHKEAKTLQQAGYLVTILCTDYEGVDEYGIKFIKVNISNKRIKRIIFCTKIFTKLALQLNCDIYHFHDPELIFAGLNLKKAGKAVVFDVHEDLPLQIMNKPWIIKAFRKPIAAIANLIEKKTAARFDIVICTTEIIAKKFKNSIILHNYPKLDEFRDFQSKQTPYLNRNMQVCYVGAITEIRGAKHMAKAIEKTNCSLVLAGEFETKQLMNEITKNSKKIDYKGYLDRNAVLEVYSKSLAGLLILEPTPSYMESLPIKLFEYMLAGLPVIASNFEYWKRLIGENCALFVNPAETNEIASAINFIANNKERAKKMGENGREIALNRFTFESEKKRFLKHYSRLCKGKENKKEDKH